MALNGAAFAAYANAFETFVEGDTPDSLTPVLGGTAVPFKHDSEREEAAATEAGLVISCVLTVFVRVRLAVGAKYTWNGETWQVAASDPDRAGGADWPIRAELVRHAG